MEEAGRPAALEWKLLFLRGAELPSFRLCRDERRPHPAPTADARPLPCRRGPTTEELRLWRRCGGRAFGFARWALEGGQAQAPPSRSPTAPRRSPARLLRAALARPESPSHSSSRPGSPARAMSASRSPSPALTLSPPRASFIEAEESATAAAVGAEDRESLGTEVLVEDTRLAFNTAKGAQAWATAATAHLARRPEPSRGSRCSGRDGERSRETKRSRESEREGVMSVHEAAAGMAAVREAALVELGMECRLVAAARVAPDAATAAALGEEGVCFQGPHVAAVWLFRVGRVLVRLHVLAAGDDLLALRWMPLQLAKLALKSAEASQLAACEEAAPLDTRRPNGCSLWCPLCDEAEEEARQSVRDEREEKKESIGAEERKSSAPVVHGSIVRPLAVRPSADECHDSDSDDRHSPEDEEEEEEEDDGYVEFVPVTAEEMASMDLGISRMALSPPISRLRPSASAEVSGGSRVAFSSGSEPRRSASSSRKVESPSSQRKASAPAASLPSSRASPFLQRALATSPPEERKKSHARMQSLGSGKGFPGKHSLDAAKHRTSATAPPVPPKPAGKRSAPSLPRKASLDSLSRRSVSRNRSADSSSSSGSHVLPRSPSRSPKEKRQKPKPPAELLAEGLCAGCGARQTPPQQFKLCGRCHSVLYCTRECQAGDWQLHRPACSKRVRAARAPASP